MEKESIGVVNTATAIMKGIILYYVANLFYILSVQLLSRQRIIGKVYSVSCDFSPSTILSLTLNTDYAKE